jgi:hypothetical protein
MLLEEIMGIYNGLLNVRGEQGSMRMIGGKICCVKGTFKMNSKPTRTNVITFDVNIV